MKINRISVLEDMIAGAKHGMSKLLEGDTRLFLYERKIKEATEKLELLKSKELTNDN